MSGQGWIGLARELRFYLSTMSADKNAEGHYIIGNGGVIRFMGDVSEGAEIVIRADVEYYVDGKPKNLAAGLATTSYGLKVMVF